MAKFKNGERVMDKNLNMPGEVVRCIPGLGYVVKFDQKVPMEYAWNTDVTLVFESNLEKLV